jgi:hypothetical protein
MAELEKRVAELESENEKLIMQINELTTHS